MEKSYQDCFEFISVANQWISQHEEESKLKYALIKVCRKLNKTQESYREAVEEINIEHCATDAEGIILRDERGQYRYVKDELIKRNRKVNELFHKLVKVEPHYVTGVLDKLTTLEREIFAGFVLEEDQLEVVVA